ncbi:MAG: ATP-binding protein [Candidatus Hydrogenedentes bacterium]|nr:ATP-binding protein [Candidatus Hydrogenedentota bacterium]
MYCRNVSNPFCSLVFRLSLTYALCCFFSMLVVLAICYVFLEASLQRRMHVDMVNEVSEYRSLFELQSLSVLKDVLEKEAISEGIHQVIFRILDGAGNVLVSTDTSFWEEIPAGHEAIQTALSGQQTFMDYQADEGDFSARFLYGAISDQLVLQLGVSLEENHALLRQFRKIFFAATLAFVLCSILAGTYVAKRSLSGVQRVTMAAHHIAAGAWDHRVPLSSYNDEIDELANAFNDMVDRIQVLFRELRDVTDDIAHDLRTPLMRIRGEAEMALRETRDDSLTAVQCGSMLEECDQMLQLINTMLEIAQTEAGTQVIECRPVDLAAIAEDMCELFRPASEDKGVELRCSVEAGMKIAGEPQRLKRLVGQLVDNAVKYTLPGGQVMVRCMREGNHFLLEVEDSGIGIPDTAQEDIFGRFYRVDASRSEPGNGLGLSLVRAISRAFGGDVCVTSEEGKGSTFTVRFPLITGDTVC